ncbi:hypothetical protein OG361_04810 [Streptomyces sp. NBC_00090]|uniref:MarR family winged helix-turn-helix transcriptional regulator n=1 Tax=Streptomyces sp. NBC_00090 TaxID=2903619 RepID=UPI0032566587
MCGQRPLGVQQDRRAAAGRRALRAVRGRTQSYRPGHHRGITKRVDRLEGRGPVARTVAEADSRGRLVTLTAEGVALADELIVVHLDNRRRLLAGLDGNEQADHARLLERLALTLPPGEG